MTPHETPPCNHDDPASLAPAAGWVNFRIRLQCDYGGGGRWGEWHKLSMPRSQYGNLLDKLLADEEVKEFEVEYSPNDVGQGRRADER